MLFGFLFLLWRQFALLSNLKYQWQYTRINFSFQSAIFTTPNMWGNWSKTTSTLKKAKVEWILKLRTLRNKHQVFSLYLISRFNAFFFFFPGLQKSKTLLYAQWLTPLTGTHLSFTCRLMSPWWVALTGGLHSSGTLCLRWTAKDDNPEQTPLGRCSVSLCEKKTTI